MNDIPSKEEWEEARKKAEEEAINSDGLTEEEKELAQRRVASYDPVNYKKLMNQYKKGLVTMEEFWSEIIRLDMIVYPKILDGSLWDKNPYE